MHVPAATLCLAESPARRAFKAMAGQNNHFLITLLVGLSAVESGSADLPTEFRTSWAPHDRHRSATRSREFAIKAALAWLVDALDAYVRNLGRPPAVSTEEMRANLDASDKAMQGVSGRLQVIAAATGQERSAEAVLMELAIVWRNRLVHQHASSQVRKATEKAATALAPRYLDDYQGLVVGDLLERLKRKTATSPTFKEVAAIIRAAHRFVERTDLYLLTHLDADSYLREVLRQYLAEDKVANPASVRIRAGNVWGKSPDRCRSTLMQIAYNNGFSPAKTAAPNKATLASLEELVGLTPAQAIERLGV
ncbi:hypothetical protein SAMN05444157_1647 [Frankineae bacterium MT45]|nr:hypothetical protein SAMN05444157_1647 [Frankineae bacterium MT45]